MDLIKISSALISVYDKNGLDPFLDILVKNQVQIYSTGGTKSYIDSLGYSVTAVEDVTSYPSILSGRVKTLHPKIFGGILNRRENKSDIEEIKKYDIPQIDLVIVDLYPFKDTVNSDANESKIIEKIDIGGIALIRAAAKNFNNVVCVSNKSDYKKIVNILDKNKGFTSLIERKEFATKAFNVSSNYDSEINNYFKSPDKGLKIDESNSITLRYGENPHQKGIFFGRLNELIKQVNGKEISYNNLLDIDSSINLINEFKSFEPTLYFL